MVKKKTRRNKKFWSGMFFTMVGLVTLGISYLGFNFFPIDSWFGLMVGEIGGIGIPIVVIGLMLMIFNKDVKDIV